MTNKNATAAEQNAIEKQKDMKETYLNSANNPEQQMQRAHHALIKAVVFSGTAEDPHPWKSPQTTETIFTSAKVYADVPDSMWSVAFESLIAQGLFREVQKGTFNEPVFYPSYDDVFLRQLEDVHQDPEWWAIRGMNDADFGYRWRVCGLCLLKDLDAPSPPFSLCVGQACSSLANGSNECFKGLKFASHLHVRCVKCNRLVLREDLSPQPQKFLQGEIVSLVRFCKTCSAVADASNTSEPFGTTPDSSSTTN
ncbi:MAG: hypothetical protein ACXWC8_13950 [Limisphaerales bacterium]